MRTLKQTGKLFVLAAGAAIVVTGCQTYKPPMESWRGGAVAEAATQFTAKAEKNKSNIDTIVWRLEQGTALRAAGQYRESVAAFDAAEEKINAYDEQAKISVSSETGALLSNQANLPYKGRDYDKVMLNAYKALDYLQLGEPDKARVEFFRATQRQQDAEENNKKRIEKAEKEFESLKDSNEKNAASGKEMADKANADPQFKQKVATEYGYLDEFPAKANYVNPFVYYINGLYFLAANKDASDLSRARDSFRFALGSIGDNKFIKQDLEMVDQVSQGAAIPPTTYIIFETGCAPERGQIRIPIPLFLAGVKNVPYVGATFPTLKKQEGQLPRLNVTAAGANETTVLLASMDSAVGQDFKNELPTVITKTLASACIKAAASYAVNKSMEKEDVWAQLAVKILLAAVQMAVDIADTRTWNTLPKEFQFCRIATPPDRKIELSGPNGESRVDVTVEDGTVNLIYVKSINQNSPLLVSQIRLNGSTSALAGSATSVSPAEAVPATTPLTTPEAAPVPTAISEVKVSPATIIPKVSEPVGQELPVTSTPSDSDSKKSIGTPDNVSTNTTAVDAITPKP